MREALTVIGFLLILAFAALFAAPLYVDWNSWRESIASRLSQHLGTPVIIKGQIQARLLPQPWLSIGDVSIGDPYGETGLKVGAIDGNVSLGGLLRGSIDLSDVVIHSPRLTLSTNVDGVVEPLSQHSISADAAVESFAIQDGSLRYINAVAGQDVTVTGIHLTGQSRSLFGPYKAEGGARFGSIEHAIKLSTGIADKGVLRLQLDATPADRPLTIDLDGDLKVDNGKPSFAGTAAMVHAANAKNSPQSNLGQSSWTIAGPVTITPAALTSTKLAVQFGPDERTMKLGGTLEMLLGPDGSLEAALSGSQLDLDRFAGVNPDKRLSPAVVLGRVIAALPDAGTLASTAHFTVSTEGAMLGGELVANTHADVYVADGQWRVDHFETDLPGQSHLLLAGDVNGEAGGFNGHLSLQSRQATGMMSWLQASDVSGGSNSARKLTLTADLVANSDNVTLSKLAFAVDAAKVNGQVAWKWTSPARSAGRIEANLSAQRIDLDVLPSVASLLPGGSDIFSEADITLSAQALAFSGIEAKSVSGHVKAGGKLIALEDVAVNDLGGASLTANGRIDNIGAQPQGEIRVVLNGRDLSGLATALKRSSLPAYWVNAFASRAAALSPANASLVVAFGTSRQYSIAGKFGGSVVQFESEFTGQGDQQTADIKLNADSFDIATLTRQAGLAPAAGRIAGRASFDGSLSGPLNGAMRWNGNFDAAGLSVQANGKMTGSFEAPAFDGRLKVSSDDVLVPAQLFGVALPGVMAAQGASIDSGFRLRAGRMVLDDVQGTVLDMPINGAVTITSGTPARIDGRLRFMRADAEVLGSLLAGSDLGAANQNGDAWSDQAFGAGMLDNVAGNLAISADTLRFTRRLPDLTRAKAVVSFDGNKVNIDSFQASLAGGTATGALQLSRVGPDMTTNGRFAIQNATLTTQDLSGTLNTSLDFVGGGRTPEALMSSLTGGGTVNLLQPALAGLSDSAFAETVAAVDGGLAADAAHVEPAFEQSLALKPAVTGSITGNLSLAGGVVRLASTTVTAKTGSLNLSGMLDLSDLTARAAIDLTPPDLKDGFGGAAPTIPIQIAGPLQDLRRSADVSGLTAWLNIRAAEQQARKLEVLEAQRQAEDKIQDEARRVEAAQMQKAIDEAKRKAQMQNSLPASPAPAGPSPNTTPPASPPLNGTPLKDQELPKGSTTPFQQPLPPMTAPPPPDYSSDPSHGTPNRPSP